MNNYRHVFLILLASSVLFCCNRKSLSTTENQFVYYQLKNRDDETLKKLKSTFPNLVSEEKNFLCNFKFILSEKVSYQKDYVFQKTQRCKNFNSKVANYDITKVDEKTFYLENDSFKVYKYYYDELNSWDEEETILVNDELGILFIHQYWGESYEIESHPYFKDEQVKELKMLIINDKKFYKTWDSCLWN